jgi:hypothetical protein
MLRAPVVLPERLPPQLHEVLKPYLAAVTRLLGERLEAVLLYGSAARGEYLHGRSNINILLMPSAHDTDLPRRYAKIHRRWAKENIVAPLILTQDDMTKSAGVFPLEYLELHEAHVLLAGRDPFAALSIDQSRLGWECVHQLESHLIRFRQRLIEAGGKHEGEAMLLPIAITGLAPLLRGLLRVAGRPVPASTDGVFGELASLIGGDVEPLRDAWRLKRGEIGPGPAEMPRLMDRYVEIVERIAAQARRICEAPAGAGER